MLPSIFLHNRSTVPYSKMVNSIWAQIHPYFAIAWEKYLKKVESGKLTAERAWFLFTKDYGDDSCICSLVGKKLVVPFKPFGIV
jgi:hypothetical protein